jgi:hypothetical protein
MAEIWLAPNGRTYGEGGLGDSGGSHRLDGRGDRAGGILGRLLNVLEDVLSGRDCGVAAERENGSSAHGGLL